MNKSVPRYFFTLQTVMLAALLAMAILLDGAFARGPYFLAGVAFVAVIVALPGLLSSLRRSTTLLLLMFGGGLCGAAFFTTTSAKTFMRFHNEIRIGMTKNEVQTLLAVHYPTAGRFALPQRTRVDGSTEHYFIDSTHDRVDSITVHYMRGRVVAASHLGD